MKKNKRNKIIGLSIGIFVVLIIVVSSTYAYWQITKTQKTPNDIVAACLSLDLNDGSAENTGIDLDSAWPISDEEGKELTGYTFTVTNNCDEEINYIVGLNRVEESNYLQDSSIKLQLDDNSTFLYSDLSDVEYADVENTDYTSRVSKQVSVETIGANGTNTHTIKLWVSDEAPVSEQSKIFKGQIFITGGQGIEVPECFTIADNGTLLDYDYSCGTEAKVPAEVNGIQVKRIDYGTFSTGEAVLIDAYNETADTSTMYVYLKDSSNKDALYDLLQESICDSEDPDCILENMGIIFLNNIEEYNAIDWTQYGENYMIMPNYGLDSWLMEKFNGQFTITSLDLSDAIYLETIAAASFGGNNLYSESINDTCSYISSKDKYECNSNLLNVTLPQNGNLKTIGMGAFSYTLIPKIIIPSSVTSIGDEAFNNNPKLTDIIIKRTEEDALANITFGEAWNGSATVTYNPDYTE